MDSEAGLTLRGFRGESGDVAAEEGMNVEEEEAMAHADMDEAGEDAESKCPGSCDR